MDKKSISEVNKSKGISLSKFLMKNHDKEKMQNKLNEFSSCHHCKYFFQEKNLIKCKYRSSKMGVHILNCHLNEPVLSSSCNYLYEF